MQKKLEAFWHGTLRRPYRLAKTYDSGDGPAVVLLHGLGRSARVWQEVIQLLSDQPVPCRAVAYDLLGFGASPKPARISYTVDDHAAAVIAQLQRLGRSKPVVLVGHSMGCLVAVRVAKLRPDLVQHLVLYEMPVYEGLPEKWRYKTRLNIYFRLYEWISRQNPSFDELNQRFKERLSTKIVGTELTAETWQPFVKSLKNTIMKQSAAQDLPTLPMPADIIYGSRDVLVIRGKVHQVLGLDSKLVTLHTIKERHVISRQASAFIVDRIQQALTPNT
ncbi:MAG: alpha/beta hydrolase [Patescibacteria group bacterium]|nr:alpha/beta hydrolase [Patescibacteria group bacterium]